MRAVRFAECGCSVRVLCCDVVKYRVSTIKPRAVVQVIVFTRLLTTHTNYSIAVSLTISP